MDNLNRETLDCEMERIQQKLQDCEPGSKEYHDIRIELTELSRIANEDDKIKNEFEVARARNESESEKVDKDEKLRRRQWIRDFTVPLVMTIITGTFNLVLQRRTQSFEEKGMAYTSRFKQFQMNAPNPKI